MSRGHGSSRRRSYGRRQREIRDRRGLEPSIDLDGPGAWPRGGAWDTGSASGDRGEMERQHRGGAA